MYLEAAMTNERTRLDLTLYACRFRLHCIDAIHFADGKSGNILRGALGDVLRGLTCDPDCPGAKECPERYVCAYARLFEPTAWSPGPSGLSDLARPFVLRASHLDGKTLRPRAIFEFDLHLFDLEEAALLWLVRTFLEMARVGLGPRRGRVQVEAVWGLDASGDPVSLVFDGVDVTYPVVPPTIICSLEPSAEPVTRARVEFATPTELKANDEVVREPEFGVLFARIRDRVSRLRDLYGGGPLQIDFRGTAERAARVEMVSSRLEWRCAERRSSKTGLRHPVDGFVGEAEYAGDLAEFVPYLAAAYWSGVGKQTVWGKGAVKLVEVG